MIQHKDPHSADHLQANTNRTSDALIAMDATQRRKKSAAVAAQWKRRHELARAWITKHPVRKLPDVPKNLP